MSEAGGDEQLLRYRITCCTEWEILEIEALAPDDERAVSKARRYCSLKHMGRNFPFVILAEVTAEDGEAWRPVGTWEYWIRPTPGIRWHPGRWNGQPELTKKSLRQWAKLRQAAR